MLNARLLVDPTRHTPFGTHGSDKPQQRVWIGLTDTRRRSDEMLFRWTSGEDVRYSNWGEKQPSNQILGDRSEDCVSTRQV